MHKLSLPFIPENERQREETRLPLFLYIAARERRAAALPPKGAFFHHPERFTWHLGKEAFRTSGRYDTTTASPQRAATVSFVSSPDTCNTGLRHHGGLDRQGLQVRLRRAGLPPPLRHLLWHGRHRLLRHTVCILDDKQVHNARQLQIM